MNSMNQQSKGYKYIFSAIINFTLLLLILSYNTSCTKNKNSLLILNNTCNNLENPLNITSQTPKFGWQLQSHNNDIMQSAYQIELYTDESGKNEMIWDSEKIKSDQCQGVKPSMSESLKPGAKYQWRVRVWDDNDRVSRWSDLNSFRLPPDDIESGANWIGAIRPEDSNIPEGRTYHGLSINSETGKKWQETNPLSKRSIYLRKEFSDNKKIKIGRASCRERV